MQLSGSCDAQSLLNALAGLVVAITPGIVALLLALSNRNAIRNVPKRSTDRSAGPPSPPAGSNGT